MQRCSQCDACSDPGLTNTISFGSLSFYEDPEHPHLLVCSECSNYYTTDEALEDGEVPNLESMWDD